MLLSRHTRRREFITLASGAAATWTFAASAQQPERMRRIGIILPGTADDARFQTLVGAFLQELQSSGWSIGRNVRIDTRWATANAAAIRKNAAELVALTPDVILAFGGSTVAPLLQATRTVPIVFAVASDPVGNLIVTTSGQAYIHRDLIVMLAARLKLPAVYYEHSFVAAGGLMSYGSDYIDQFRRAAAYVDRILKGEKPADLPVQAPTKYELVINLKTAKALGLEIPSSVLGRADEVIE
jgi:ABC-type uncharacterized transport system substrate-binding protein